MLRKFICAALLALGLAGTAFAQTAKDPAAPPEPPDFWPRLGRGVLLYLPNRLLDINDLITLKVGGGSASALEIKMTDYGRLGGFTGNQYFIASAYHRQFGGGYQDGQELAFGHLVYDEYVVDDTSGTVSPYLLGQEFGPVDTNQNAYRKELIDPWAIGVAAGLFANVRCEFNFREFPDLLLGFFCFDPSHDDYH